MTSFPQAYVQPIHQQHTAERIATVPVATRFRVRSKTLPLAGKITLAVRNVDLQTLQTIRSSATRH